jgi:hypothetical protein
MEIVKKTTNEIEIIQKFIFNENVQNILSNINDSFMDFNILDITGMGNQEIKHSNILGWLFDNSEHNLEYYVLDNFLKRIIEQNRTDNQVINTLQSYIYLSNDKKNITIYREKDNIDLLIVDDVNKVVFIIENKIYATERIDGDDNGQLSKYETIINNKKEFKDYQKYFIYLTTTSEQAIKGEEYWLQASHQMITDIIEVLLNTKKDLSTKTKIILESYVDLLKRNNIVEDKKIKELCKKIWNNKGYTNALEIIINNKPNKYDDIKEWINDFGNTTIISEKTFANADNIFLQFNTNSPLIYRLYYRRNKHIAIFIIIKTDDEVTIDDKVIFENEIGFKRAKESDGQYGYSHITKDLTICNDIDINKEQIVNLLAQLNEIDKDYTFKLI